MKQTTILALLSLAAAIPASPDAFGAFGAAVQQEHARYSTCMAAAIKANDPSAGLTCANDHSVNMATTIIGTIKATSHSDIILSEKVTLGFERSAAHDMYNASKQLPAATRVATMQQNLTAHQVALRGFIAQAIATK